MSVLPTRQAVSAIARRDLTVVARSKAVMLPIVILPVVFFVVMPAVLTFAVFAGGDQLREIVPLLERLPPQVRDQLGGGTVEQQVLVFLIEFQFASLFHIIPLMVAAVIAADSFAGEKERRTLEALLYTPTTDRQLYLAKLAGPWAAAVTVTAGGFVMYALTANLLAAGAVGRLLVITPMWLVNLGLVSPAVAALALGALVIVSARVRTFQDAYQLGALIVLPLVLLVAAQFAGVLFLDLPVVIVLGVVVWLVAGAVLWLGYRSFRRERLLLAT